MSQPLHIGLLLCHTFAPVLKQVGGLNYSAIFQKEFLAVDSGVVLTNFNAYKGELPNSVDQCDVWLINGSPSGVYDDMEWIHQLGHFVKQLHAAKKPTVGICFGHQLMAQVLGGLVERSKKGWGIGISRNTVVAKADCMHPMVDTIDVMVFHQDQVVRVPEGSKVLAGNAFCPNHIIQYNDHMLSIQGHPEFNSQMVESLLGAESFDNRPAIRAQGIANSVGKPNAKLLFQWIVNFYRQATIIEP